MRTSEAACRGWIVRGLAAILACLLAASPGLAANKGKSASPAASKGKATFCASDRDLAALNARVLQTELMVAALSCEERPRYNRFVTAYQKSLVDQGQALQALFKRAHGKKAGTQLNAFITRLANDASKDVMARGVEYCVFAMELFDEATVAPALELSQLANKPWIAKRHGFQPCVVEASRKQTG